MSKSGRANGGSVRSGSRSHPSRRDGRPEHSTASIRSIECMSIEHRNAMTLRGELRERNSAMLAAIYGRKSTDQPGGADEQKSVTRQVDNARAFALEKGWV